MNKNKSWLWVLIVIVIVGAFVVLWKTGLISQVTVGGYQVLSISKADLVEDDVLGKSWFVTVSTIPSSFVLLGKVQAGDVAKKVGETPESDFDIKIGVDQYLKYAIKDSGVVIYDYYVTASDTFTCVGGEPKCGVSGGNSPFSSSRVKYSGVIFNSCQDFCVYRVASGKIGTVQANPSIPSNITIVVSAKGETSDVVKLQTDKNSVGNKNIVVDGKVLGRVFYNGDLINSAETKPELFQDYKPVNVGGKWVFTKISSYNNYNVLNSGGFNKVQNDIQNCFNTKVSDANFKKSNGVSMINECIAPYHSAFSGLKEVSIDGLDEIKNESGNIYATFDAPKLLAFPVLTFVLDVDWVGVKVLKGVPKINTATVTGDCVSGSRGEVTAVVSNIGNDVGAFDVSMSCEKMEVLTSVYTVNIDAGKSKNFAFKYDINDIQSKVSDKCVVVAKDKGSDVSVSKSVSVSCNPTVICVAGTTRCEGVVKLKCNDEGSDWEIVVGDTSCENNWSCKTDVDCGVMNVCVDGVCVAGETCEDALFGLIQRERGVKESCNFWCKIGLKQEEKINVCVRDYTPLVLLIVGVLALVSIVVFGTKKDSGKKKGGSSVGGESRFGLFKSKVFWIVVLVLVGLSLLVGFFKYVFWGFVSFLILALLLKLLFGVNVIKLIFRR